MSMRFCSPLQPRWHAQDGSTQQLELHPCCSVSLIKCCVIKSCFETHSDMSSAAAVPAGREWGLQPTYTVLDLESPRVLVTVVSGSSYRKGYRCSHVRALPSCCRAPRYSLSQHRVAPGPGAGLKGTIVTGCLGSEHPTCALSVLCVIWWR